MPPETTRNPSDGKAVRQRLRVRDHLLLIVDELRLHGFEEADRFGGDDVHQRSALRAGKTVLSMSLPYFSRARIMPGRADRAASCASWR